MNQSSSSLKKLLIVGDSPTLQSGFSRVVQSLAWRWRHAFEEIHFWGIGWAGYPGAPDQKRPWFLKDPFTLYPASGSGPWYSQENMTNLLRHIHRGDYSHVWTIQDSFLLRLHNFPAALEELTAGTGTRTFLYLPVDATLDKDWAQVTFGFDCTIAYTEYGRDQIQQHVDLPEQRLRVLPHGVDPTRYRLLPEAVRANLRAQISGWIKPGDVLLINVNTNQRRKDVVRSLEILSTLYQRSSANWRFKLLMHMSRHSSGGDQVDLELAAKQLGLIRGQHWDHTGNVFVKHLATLPEESLVQLYNIADGYLTTTLGEGWGLGITEALACGLPVAIPTHTACQEIAEKLEKLQMGNRVIRLPTEPHIVCLPNDNCRLRQRVDVDRACDALEKALAAGVFAEKQPMNNAVRDWLSWDRIAGEFLDLFRSVGKVRVKLEEIGNPKPQPDQQTAPETQLTP